MEDRLEALYSQLDEAIPRLEGCTADRIRSIFALYFGFETRQVQLFLAHISAAYDWTLSPAARPFGRNLRLRAVMRELLAEGVARGDVDPQADLDAIIDLLLSAYAWRKRPAPRP
jgi:hypothetical protein